MVSCEEFETRRAGRIAREEAERLRGVAAVPDPARLREEDARQAAEECGAMTEPACLLPTPETQYGYLPDQVFQMAGIPRPRVGLDEADTALMLDAGSWQFPTRVGGAS